MALLSIVDFSQKDRMTPKERMAAQAADTENVLRWMTRYPEALGQLIGKDHILAGNVSTSVLATGSPEADAAEVARCRGAV